MPKAVILGGTGLVGRAVARRLSSSGWTVVSVARTAGSLPRDLVCSGVVLRVADRTAPEGLENALAEGADLLVDCVCYTAADANRLLPFLGDVGSTVMLSTKAVYVDERGRHINSPTSPRFTGPITEQNPTMAPGNGDHDSPEGYGANKVAAERTLLDSGRPVTVLRASKIHGEGASPPREWVFVKRALDERKTLFLRRRGASVDHTTAAVNLAALAERVAWIPGRRILNIADPDSPSVLEIARTVGAHFGHEWDLRFVDATSPLGRTPWDTAAPIVLDMSAASLLGHVPVGTYAEPVGPALDRLAEQARRAVERGEGDEAIVGASFTGRFLDYAAEDAVLRSGAEAAQCSEAAAL
ncbi:NAD-dependent epimerase/dehydratase family protein [Nocardiopsis halophila]|uniref:NAD-dependent epimerase/dehydratase family protein n=1 Tax=Nocardiopsis halophila TaxID=141692 RepID=UPI000A03123E|nr:NAD-dependent epimerase/dehydratase family protein [Nocardiopsis halophila]